MQEGKGRKEMKERKESAGVLKLVLPRSSSPTNDDVEPSLHDDERRLESVTLLDALPCLVDVLLVEAVVLDGSTNVVLLNEGEGVVKAVAGEEGSALNAKSLDDDLTCEGWEKSEEGGEGRRREGMNRWGG
jgi:hypothetical protein